TKVKSVEIHVVLVGQRTQCECVCAMSAGGQLQRGVPPAVRGEPPTASGWQLDDCGWVTASAGRHTHRGLACRFPGIAQGDVQRGEVSGQLELELEEVVGPSAPPVVHT